MNSRNLLQFPFRKRLIAASIAGIIHGVSNLAYGGAGISQSPTGPTSFNDVPTYYANSPAGSWIDYAGHSHDSGTALRKFVDPMPPLCASNSNNAQAAVKTAAAMDNKCIPIAVADTTTFPGSDYYEIGIVEYTEQMHSDLPKATKLRGYVQLVPGTSTPMTAPHFLGPTIVAKQHTPVRIMYRNLLPAGDLFLPVDETLTGAGIDPTTGNLYTQNRTAVHLHGGDSAWISDGTPHQWVSSETQPAGKGVSQQNVPDMWFSAPGKVVPAASVPADPKAAGYSNDPSFGQGTAGTLFWTNNDSARLMFYHDHASAITRLNVYAGIAAGYLLTDDQEANLPADQNSTPLNPLNGNEIPLVIQERTFVPKDIAVQDAKWDSKGWGANGDLWFPHVYETNQDPNSYDGTNPPGRWDYAGYFWPIYPVTSPIDVMLDLTGEHLPGKAGLAKVTTTPEAFGDTPLVNGTAYPYLDVEPRAYRFRVLNATNDRTLNMGLYLTDPTTTVKDDPTVYSNANNYTATRTDTEVKMIPFDNSGVFPTTGGLLGTGWGQPDARAEGVPDPKTAGPDIVQIGNEGGFLPAPVDIPSTITNYEYNKRSVTVLNVMERGLYMMPAERADVVIDFSKFAGQTIILYNDAPAPNPAGDPRIDYFTDDPDQTNVGGAPTTLAGYGPNTRTIMQFRVGPGDKINNIAVNDGGLGYVSPQVSFVGGGAATQPVAHAVISTTPNTISVDQQGGGYTAPVVKLTGGGATTQAKAFATVEGPVNRTINVISTGQGYDPQNPPNVTIVDAGLMLVDNTTDHSSLHDPENPLYGTQAELDTRAQATAVIGPLFDQQGNPIMSVPSDLTPVPVQLQGVTSITVTNPGSGYVNPQVNVAYVIASATVALGDPNTKIHTITVDPSNLGAGYSSAPTVNITDSTGSNASATATLAPGTITSIVLDNPGSGFKSVPQVKITDTSGGGALTTVNFLPMPVYAFDKLSTALPKMYAASRPAPLVPETVYNAALGTSYADTQPKISQGSYLFPTMDYTAPSDTTYTTYYTSTVLTGPLSYVDQKGVTQNLAGGSTAKVPVGTQVTVLAGNTIQMPVRNKAIQELFDPNGRMNATLGTELPATSQTTQTTIPLGYIDPATESIADGETQFWKITHNGVDAHPVHFHLVNVQLINRVGWDGTRKWPTPNEYGWKETIKMNPLEDVYIAVRAKAPKLPFSIPNSSRLLDPSQKQGGLLNFTNVDPYTNLPITITNQPADFGWEYVWHCHILGHEENDFMRPFIFTGATNYNTVDKTPPTVTASVNPPANAAGWNNTNATVAVTATDNAAPNGSGIASITYSADGAQATAAPITLKAANNVTYSFTGNDTITTEGTTNVTASAIDQAATPTTGNLLAPLTVKLDKTLPTTAISLSSAANAAGWNNSAVTASITATDALSGVATLSETINGVGPTSVSSSTDSKAYSSDSKNTINVTSSDIAGNVSVATTANVWVDTTVPTVSGAVTPKLATGVTWYGAKNAPSVNWTATDPVTNGVSSGIQTQPAATLVTTEGPNQSVTSPTVSDIAGNTAASVTVSGINFDKTPPVVGALPAPNANGWYGRPNLTTTTAAISVTNPLKLNFLGGTTDALPGSGVGTVTGVPALTSGIATFTAQSVAAGTTETVTATDVAGNSIITPVFVKIDTTVPTIAKTRTPSANANGWNNAAVTVTYTGTDALSGLDSITETIAGAINGVAQTSPVTVPAGTAATQTYNASGTQVSINAVSNDKAGNVSAVSATDVINIDTVVPTFAAETLTPAANAAGWNNANVTVAFNCQDALSGIATCPNGSVTASSATAAGTTVTGTATDKAGNTATKTVNVKLDKTAPTIAKTRLPAANGNGWNNAPVVVTYTGTDALSGVASTTETITGTINGVVQTSPVTVAGNPVVATYSTSGTQVTIKGVANDNAGNTTATATAVDTINIDTVVPTIALAALTPAANANGWNNANVTVSYTCTDALSGISTCANTTVNIAGTGVSTTGTATDKAGNSATTTVSVNLDKTVPTIGTLAVSGAAKTGTSVSATLNLPFTETLSGVDFANSSATYTIMAGAITYASGSLTVGTTSASVNLSFTGSAAKTTYTVTVTPVIKDKAGNAGATTGKTVTFSI